jgi:cytoskeletal protein CcmA (bactofilin family)
MLAGGQVELRQESSIEGNAYLAGGSVTSSGTVKGTLAVGAGEVQLNGTTEGDVLVEAQSLRLGPSARIAGDLRYRVPPENVRIDPAATIVGQRVVMTPRPKGPSPRFFSLLWVLGFLVAGSLAVLLFPGTAAAASDNIAQRAASAAGVGLLLIIVIPIALVLLMATVIGIPFALIALTSYAILLYLSGAVSALWLGARLLKRETIVSRARLVLAFLAGGAILAVAYFVPLLGFLVVLLATVLGAGGLALAIAPALKRGYSQT